MSVQRVTLAVVCLATAMLMLDIAVVNTAIPHISHDLNTGLSGVQWVVDAYTLALASVVLTAGSLADRLGRRRVFSAGVVLFTASSLAAALADSIEVLNIARAVQGIGGAIMFAVSLALLAHAFPNARERAGALAAYGATIGAAFAVGPAVGGLLTSGLGWRSIFFVNIPLGVGVLAATRMKVEESRDPETRSIDWLGQAVLSGGLFLLVLGLLRGNEQGWGSFPIVAELSGAAILLVLFVLVEQRVKSPMLPLGLFRIPSFTGAQVAAFAISGSFFAVFFYTTIYLQNVLHMSAVDAGLAYLPSTVVMFFVAGGSAQLLEKVSPRVMIGGGLALVSAGLLLLTTIEPGSSWTVTIPGMVLAGIGTGLFNPSLSGVALNSVPERMSGLAAGVNDTFRQAAIAVGIAALGALIPTKAALGQGDPADFVHGLQDALTVGAALAAAGAIATAFLIRPARSRSAAPARLAADCA